MEAAFATASLVFCGGCLLFFFSSWVRVASYSIVSRALECAPLIEVDHAFFFRFFFALTALTGIEEERKRKGNSLLA